MKYTHLFIWLMVLITTECKMMQNSNHNSPVEKNPSPSNDQFTCLKPAFLYRCIVKSFSQQSCNSEFDELGPLKAHLRSVHGFPMPVKNIENYYKKIENK